MNLAPSQSKSANSQCVPWSLLLPPPCGLQESGVDYSMPPLIHMEGLDPTTSEHCHRRFCIKSNQNSTKVVVVGCATKVIHSHLSVLHCVPQMISHASKAPLSKLILELWQHFCHRARAERGFSPPVSPADSPSACTLPLAQTAFTISTTNTVIVTAAAAAPPWVWHGGWTCTSALWSRCLSWPRQCCVDGLFPVRGAVWLRYVGWVSDGGVQGPLGGPHVREGRVQPRGLAGVGVVWPWGLVVSVFSKLSPGGQWGEGRTVVRKAEGSVGDMGTGWGCLYEVTTSTSGLALDLGLGGIWAQRGAMMLLRLLLLLGEPGCWVSTGRCQSWGDAISVRRGWSSCWSRYSRCALPNPRVPIGGKVLVKLIHIKRFHVDHHLMAHLTNVHVTKVNVRFPRSRSTWASLCSHCATGAPIPNTLPFSIPCLTRLRLSLGSGGRCGRTVTLTCGDTRKHIVSVILLGRFKHLSSCGPHCPIVSRLYLTLW